MVLTVCGLVGLVELGSTFACPATTMMSGASPLGVVGVDAALADGSKGVLREPGFVEGVGVQRHLDSGLVRHPETGVDGGGRRAPVLVQLESRDPPRSCSQRDSDDTVLPFPSSATFTGSPSSASSIRAVAQAPGVTVVARVPPAGMSRRWPQAASRSSSRPGLASAKW